MKATILNWRHASGIAFMAAIVGGVAPHAGASQAASAYGADKAQAHFYLTPSIHQNVMGELMSAAPESAGAEGRVNRPTGGGSSAAEGQVPTSMLWPAYKYFPHSSHSLTA
jgi:hypothetical protein